MFDFARRPGVKPSEVVAEGSFPQPYTGDPTTCYFLALLNFKTCCLKQKLMNQLGKYALQKLFSKTDKKNTTLKLIHNRKPGFETTFPKFKQDILKSLDFIQRSFIRKFWPISDTSSRTTYEKI